MNQRKTTELRTCLQAHDTGRLLKNVSGLNMFEGVNPPLTWDSDVTAQHKNGI